LTGVGKLASGRGHVHQVGQNQIRAELGFLRHQRSAWPDGNVPLCLAEALGVCVRVDIRDRLKGNPELRGDELTHIKGYTANHLSIRCSRHQLWVTAIRCNTQFPQWGDFRGDRWLA
jgi:hypothetical protein